MPTWLTTLIQAVAQWEIWTLGKAKAKQDSLNAGKTQALEGLKDGDDQAFINGVTQIGDAKK